MEIILGGVTFKTKTAARDYVNENIRAGPERKLEGKHFLVAIDLITMRNDFEEIEQCGIKEVWVFWLEKNCKPHWTTKIVRLDGSEEIVGLNSGFNPPSQKVIVMKAMRAEIADQVIEYKQRHFDLRNFAECEESGKLVSFNECHVDHCGHGFDKLAEDFLKTQDVETKYLTGAMQADRIKMSDKMVARNWRDYHRAKAKLKVVSIEAHKQLTRQRRDIDTQNSLK